MPEKNTQNSVARAHWYQGADIKPASKEVRWQRWKIKHRLRQDGDCKDRLVTLSGERKRRCRTQILAAAANSLGVEPGDGLMCHLA